MAPSARTITFGAWETKGCRPESPRWDERLRQRLDRARFAPLPRWWAGSGSLMARA
jgi:hypothetical protein